MNIDTILTFLQEISFMIFLLVGLVFCFIGIVGLFRFKNIYSKQHATGLIDTMGILFICVSLAIKSGLALVSFKPIFLALFIVVVNAPICYSFMQILINREQDKILEEIKKNR